MEKKKWSTQKMIYTADAGCTGGSADVPGDIGTDDAAVLQAGFQ